MMEVDPQAIEALLNRMDDDDHEDRDGDLQAFFEVAYPTLESQNS